MKYQLVAIPNPKMVKHAGLFSHSYQVSRAKYDAQIRNWDIEFRDNLFHVTNSEGLTETCYLELNKIHNCSCLNFAETESGTCMHLEAILRLNLPSWPTVKIRPLTFINKFGQMQNLAKVPSYETPAIATFKKLQENRKLSFNEMVYPDLDVFKDSGINLWSFQKESIAAMLKNMRSILTLRMGLGKTLCALACCKLLDKPKILIIAPNSLKYQWAREIARFNLGSSLVVAKRSDLTKFKDQRFLIVSYEMLNFNKQLLNDKYDIVIPDEIQKIKNQESETWKTVTQLKSDYIFALSGTPIQNNINDLISLINFLNPMEFKPEWKFYKDFCDCTKSRILGILPTKIPEFKKKINRYLINPKVDYSSFPLPTKKEIVTSTGLNAKQLEIHNGYFEMARILLAKSMNSVLSFEERIRLNAYLTKARMAATDGRLLDPAADKSDKFDKVEQLIKQLSSDKKIVLYSEWIKSLELLRPFLEAEKIPYVFFTGEMTAKKRNQTLMDFLEQDEIKVFLSTDTGGLGVDGLQLVSHNVIHLEKIWNPMKIEQRNGRLVRTLQPAKEVNVHYFYTNAGVESLIGDNNTRKRELIFDIL